MSVARLAYSVSGTPRRGTIVAFHGVTDSAASLHDLAHHYNDSRQVYLVDTLGHGLSPRFTRDRLDAPFNAALTAAQKLVTHIATESPSRSVTLIGHSLGGAIAAYVAAAIPQFIDGLLLEDPALLTEEQAAMYAADAPSLAARQENVARFPGEAINSLQASYPNWPASEATAWAQGKIEVDLDFVRTGIVGVPSRDILKKLTVPTLLISGDGEDVLFDTAGINDVTALKNPWIRAEYIPDASHTVRRDQRERFYDLSDTFLDSLPPRPARFHIDPELEPLIATIPEQTTWDAPHMRAVGEERLGGPVDLPADASRETLELGGVETRIIRIHSASNTDEATEYNPKIIVFAPHGGGYVAGRAHYDDQRNYDLASLIPHSIVASPEYRLAPEHPWPTGREDCLNSLTALADMYPEAHIVLYGDSAGSGLVREILEHAPDALFTRITKAILLEPCIDPYVDTRSYHVLKNGPVWTHEASAAAWHAYLGSHGAEVVEPVRHLATPPQDVESSVNFPPTLIVVNAADPLRDEGITLALTLAESGIPVELHMPTGTFHGALSVAGSRVWTLVQSYIRDFLNS